MSITGVSGSNWVNSNSQAVQNNSQQLRKDFAQLGQDLQSGSVSSAQQDFATLQQLVSQSGSSSLSQSDTSINQIFNQLAQDLKAGNVSAAQQDYTKIQQDFQSQAGRVHHHHHHLSGDGSSQISQLLNQLGQDLQAGNLANAQQVYATLQQDLPQFATSNSAQPSSPSNSGSVSVNA